MELFCDIHTVLYVYACGMFHFIKCQSALAFVWMAIWDFLRGIELCFKGITVLMNIPFPHEITSCNNTAARLLKDIPLQKLQPLLRAHTLVHTFFLKNATGFPCIHPPCKTHTHTHIQVDYVYLGIWMFIFNLPFSAQVLSDNTPCMVKFENKLL